MNIPYVIKKNGMYYGHNSCGYTSRVLLAELYTKEEAEAEARMCDEIQVMPITETLTGSDEVQEYIDRMEIMRDVMKSLENE